MAVLEREVASLKEEVEAAKEEVATAVAESVREGERVEEQEAVADREKTSLKVQGESPLSPHFLILDRKQAS